MGKNRGSNICQLLDECNSPTTAYGIVGPNPNNPQQPITLFFLDHNSLQEAFNKIWGKSSKPASVVKKFQIKITPMT